MRSRRNDRDEMAAIARRRLELLSAELADLRDEVSDHRPAGPDADQPGSAGPDADEPAPETSPTGPPHRPGRHARRPVAGPVRLAGWAHDRLPPTLQGRVRLTSGHLTVVALLVAAGLALTSWWVLRAEGTTTVVPASTWTDDAADAADGSAGPEEPVALVTPAGEASEPAPADPAVVVVDVAGRVRRPGIATLPVGSRVVDALEAAGGVRRGVDLTTLNLARVLADGEQIVVGVPPPGGVAAPAASVPGASSAAGEGLLVDINAAGQTELEQLPGVGPVTAQAILQWRADHGAFTAVDELLEVSGIGEATLAEIAPHVTL